MTDITPCRDCGNSPKNQFAEKIAIALETADTDFLADVLDSDCRWESPAGDFSGAAQVLTQLAHVSAPGRLRMDHVVTHGKAGAVNGIAEMSQSGQSRRFCHVLTFANTKCRTVQRITSFS